MTEKPSYEVFAEACKAGAARGTEMVNGLLDGTLTLPGFNFEMQALIRGEAATGYEIGIFQKIAEGIVYGRLGGV